MDLLLIRALSNLRQKTTDQWIPKSIREIWHHAFSALECLFGQLRRLRVEVGSSEIDPDLCHVAIGPCRLFEGDDRPGIVSRQIRQPLVDAELQPHTGGEIRAIVEALGVRYEQTLVREADSVAALLGRDGADGRPETDTHHKMGCHQVGHRQMMDDTSKLHLHLINRAACCLQRFRYLTPIDHRQR